MLNQFHQVIVNYQNDPSFENNLKYISFETWMRIEFAYSRKGLKVYETTITQNLLFNIRLLAEEKRLPIQIFEAVSEKTNGNDIELVFEIDNSQYIKIPCQAKILQKNNKYSAINHKVGNNKYQIDLLIEYAEKVKGFPLYLFYNYFPEHQFLKKIESKIRDKDPSFNFEFYGCSLASAYQIKQRFYQKDKTGSFSWKTPNFKDIHPKITQPFYILGQLFQSKEKFLKLFTKDYESLARSIKLYSKEELIEDDYWTDLFPPPSIGKLPPWLTPPENLLDSQVNNDEKNISFNPKFRIIIHKNISSFKTKISIIR